MPEANKICQRFCRNGMPVEYLLKNNDGIFEAIIFLQRAEERRGRERGSNDGEENRIVDKKSHHNSKRNHR